MQSKTLAIFALSASAVIASPFHKRAEYVHHHLHRTGNDGVRATGTGRAFPSGNNTDGFFTPSGTDKIMPVTQVLTVSPLPEVTGESCSATSVATETSVNLVTVTASISSVATDTFVNLVTAASSTSSVATETSVNSVSVTASASGSLTEKSVNLVTVASSTASLAISQTEANAFYGQSRSRGSNSNWGQSSTSASKSAPSAVPSAANPSTTFATVTGATKSSGASSSAKISEASSSAKASASAPVTGSSGGKRGISYNDATLVSKFGKSVSWAYNWGSTAGGSPGVEFVPMMWGRNDVSSFASKVGSATHVLSFNEPDLGAQSNIDPQTAAQLHREGMADLVGKVQIGSPSVTNGGSTSPPMGVNWLDQFFIACGTDCPVDFVTFHWYATADSIEYFKSHTQDIINVAAKHGVSKVWLTEFEPSGTADAQSAFMKQAVAFLDSTPAVERYAAFMASEGTMLSGGSLNAVGSAYAA